MKPMIDWEWRPYALVIRIKLPSKLTSIYLTDTYRTRNYQPQWEREKKQFRAVDPLGKPLPREAVRAKKPVPLWRSYHSIPKRW